MKIRYLLLAVIFISGCSTAQPERDRVAEFSVPVRLNSTAHSVRARTPAASCIDVDEINLKWLDHLTNLKSCSDQDIHVLIEAASGLLEKVVNLRAPDPLGLTIGQKGDIRGALALLKLEAASRAQQSASER